MAYEYPTNFSGGQTIDSISGIFNYAMLVTNETFAYGILIIIWMMAFLGTMAVNSRKAIMSATFITWVFSIFFMRLQLVKISVVVVLTIVFIISLILGAKEGAGAY